MEHREMKENSYLMTFARHNYSLPSQWHLRLFTSPNPLNTPTSLHGVLLQCPPKGDLSSVTCSEEYVCFRERSQRMMMGLCKVEFKFPTVWVYLLSYPSEVWRFSGLLLMCTATVCSRVPVSWRRKIPLSPCTLTKEGRFLQHVHIPI
jgi:hypothetical protein